MTDKRESIKEVLERAIDKIYPSKQSLEKALSSNRKLKIYLGIDPTGPHLHLGHATNLIVLKRLQNLGHHITFLIGDFTGRIGDPSDRLAARKPLTEKEAKNNLRTFKDQASKIIDFSGNNKASVDFNSRWHSKMTFADVLKLAELISVQQLIKRSMFQKRLKEDKTVGAHELLYPLMQGYDSVAMDVDMEIGGTDQTFNMLVGRDLMKKLKNKEKFVLTTRLLENPKTGKKLMNKSEGGLINLDDSPQDLFGKTMALPDEAITPVADFSTEMPWNEVKELKTMKPRDAKLKTAFWVVRLCHDEKTAEKVKEEFIRVFSKRETPRDVQELKIKKVPNDIVGLIVLAIGGSKSNAWRLVQKQNTVWLNNKNITNVRETLENLNTGDLLRIGKYRFFKIRVV